MTVSRPLPAGPLIAFYGDDFTGASASMEATAFAGLETVLFLSPPTPERLRAFATARARLALRAAVSPFQTTAR